MSVAGEGISQEPGLDRHEWESMWVSVEQDLEAHPDAALSQLADIVEQMVLARGYRVDDPVERAGDEPEIVATYLAARETTERAELGEASRAEVETATDDLRDIFRTLLSNSES